MGPSVKAWGGIRHFRWLRVGPSEGGTTQIHIRARHPWGATIFEVVPFSKAVVGSSGVGHHPNSDSISPSSGGLRFAQQSPLSIAAGGGSSGARVGAFASNCPHAKAGASRSTSSPEHLALRSALARRNATVVVFKVQLLSRAPFVAWRAVAETSRVGVHRLMLRPRMQVKQFVFLNGFSGGPPARGSPVVRAPWGGTYGMGVHHIMVRPAVQVKGVVFLNGISSGPPSRVSPVVRAPWGGGGHIEWGGIPPR